nr:hypothetical protein [Desulfobacula sp.]
MESLKFKPADFTKTVMEAIEPQLNEIKETEKKRDQLKAKAAGAEQELNGLELEHSRLLKADDALEDTLEDHKNKMGKAGEIENKIAVLKSFILKLTEAAGKYDQKLGPAKEQLCKAFLGAVGDYVEKARLPIADIMEDILTQDAGCRDAVCSLYHQVYKEAGIKQPPFAHDIGCFMTNLLPLAMNKASINTMIRGIRDAAKQ